MTGLPLCSYRARGGRAALAGVIMLAALSTERAGAQGNPPHRPEQKQVAAPAKAPGGLKPPNAGAPSSHSTMTLILPETLTSSSPVSVQATVTSDGTGSATKVRFEIVAGGASLSCEGSGCTASTTGGSATVTTATDGVAIVSVTPSMPGALTIQASSGALTVEATAYVAATSPAPAPAQTPQVKTGNDQSAGAALRDGSVGQVPLATGDGKPAGSRRSWFIAGAACLFCLLSLAGVFLMRQTALDKLKEAHGRSRQLEGQLAALKQRADALEPGEQAERGRDGSRQTAFPQSTGKAPQLKRTPAVQAAGGEHILPRRVEAPVEKASRAAASSSRSQETQPYAAPKPAAPEPAAETAVAKLPAGPSGNPVTDYNRARGMSDLVGEDWFHRYYTCRGLSCKNLDQWRSDPAAPLLFEASSHSKFEAFDDGTRTLIFPAFNIDYGPARESLEGVFRYPERTGDPTRLLQAAIVERGGGDLWTLREPGVFSND